MLRFKALSATVNGTQARARSAKSSKSQPTRTDLELAPPLRRGRSETPKLRAVSSVSTMCR